MKRPNLGQRWTGFLCLGVTALGWGLNWPFLKLLLQEIPPLTARGIAGVTAGLILAGIAARRGERLLPPSRALPRQLLAAFTNVFAWMGFSTVAMQWVSVGQGAMLVFTMPLWAMLFAWPIQGVRPTRNGFTALALGLTGVVVLLGGRGFAPGTEVWGTEVWLGVALALGAAITFALGTIVNGAPLPIGPITSVAWQVGLGCLPMLLLGLMGEQPHLAALSPLGWALMIYMTLVPMGICYLTWFATLRHLPPAMASTGMLLVPVIGVLSASFMLGEALGPRQITAMALTLGGVVLALRKA